MKKIFTLPALLLVSILSTAQISINLNLNHTYEGNAFALDQVIETPDFNFKITRFQYYLSNFSLIHDGGTETAIDDSYLLIDASNNSYTLNDITGITNLERIKLHFGVDQAMNHADPALQEAKHPLNYQNPTMHWGWSGGYMFAVVIGTVDVNKDGAFEEMFDIMPVADKYYTLVDLPINDKVNSNILTLNIDVRVENWLENIDLPNIGFNHGQNSTIESFTDIVQRSVFSTSAVVGQKTYNLEQNQFSIINNGNSPELLVETNSKGYILDVMTMSGKLIKQLNLESKTIKFADYAIKSGAYIISIKSDKSEIIKTEKIIINL